MPLLGTPVTRVEDARLLRGEGRFVANVDLARALHVGYVTSTLAHGRLRSVDTAAARALDGITDVITAADLDLGPLPPMLPSAPKTMTRPLLAAEHVRFVGEPIVAIVGESAAAVADAIELVEVDYEPLPAVVDPKQALTGEVLLFPEAGTNVVGASTGGAAQDTLPFDDCDVVVEAELRNQRLAPCPIETRVAAAQWTPDGRLEYHAACQGAHPIRNQLANLYGLDTQQVRVITQDVGGSFGSKARAYPEELMLPFLSRRAGRPVRWTPPRSADMVGLGHSRAQWQQIKVGGDRDGTVRCLQVHILGDSGAYPGIAPNLANNTGNLLPGPYRIEHVAWSNECVVTNTTPLVAYRGAGRPEAAALVDRAIDLFAAEIGMDAVEVRRRNLLREDEFPWHSPTGLTYDSGTYHRALELALDSVGYDELRADQEARRQRNDTNLIGIGTSVFVDRTAGVPGSEYGAVELRPDATLLIRTGSSPYGQGHYTAWAMLASDRTGIPIDRIEVIHGDTDIIPRGGITGGSRSAQKAGSAVVQAADALVDEARRRASVRLEADIDDVVLDRSTGRFHVAGAPSAAAVSWQEIAADVGQGDLLRCEADFEGDGPTFPFGAYVAVVTVDAGTGRVHLDRMVTVDDAGTVLNPLLAHGQVHGGVAQGIAQALHEEFAYDEYGNPLTATFVDYGIPTAADLPPFESHLTETPSPNNPFGFKGIAESGTIGAPPAVQNAVVDALAHLGVRHIDLPLTPERVWTAINGER
jgi:aerobic carbon-monoxide dehydrogenase large subunit